MNQLDMPRRPKNLLLDDRILAVLDEAAKNAGYKSANHFVESTLFGLLKLSGHLPSDAEPLPEGRGGKREGAGRPKVVQPTAHPDSTQSDDGNPGDGQK
jgi:hypothetical protein